MKEHLLYHTPTPAPAPAPKIIEKTSIPIVPTTKIENFHLYRI